MLVSSGDHIMSALKLFGVQKYTLVMQSWVSSLELQRLKILHFPDLV